LVHDLFRRRASWQTAVPSIARSSEPRNQMQRNGGGGGSRTRVRKWIRASVYACRHAFRGLALAGGGRPTSATSQQGLDLRVLAGQEVQSDCVGASQLQTEAAGTVVTWFYQAARATASLSFAVAVFAPFYVARGATTRDSNVTIPVETGTPPCQRSGRTIPRGGLLALVVFGDRPRNRFLAVDAARASVSPIRVASGTVRSNASPRETRARASSGRSR